MKLNGLRKIDLFSLVILYKHCEADTEVDKVEPHVMACFARSTFYLLWCFIAMVSEDLFDNFSAKGIHLHQYKRKACRTKFIQYHKVKFVITCVKHLTFLYAIQIMFVMLQYCCSCQMKLSGSINNLTQIFHLAILTIGQLSVF